MQTQLISGLSRTEWMLIERLVRDVDEALLGHTEACARKADTRTEWTGKAYSRGSAYGRLQQAQGTLRVLRTELRRRGEDLPREAFAAMEVRG